MEAMKRAPRAAVTLFLILSILQKAASFEKYGSVDEEEQHWGSADEDDEQWPSAYDSYESAFGARVAHVRFHHDEYEEFEDDYEEWAPRGRSLVDTTAKVEAIPKVAGGKSYTLKKKGSGFAGDFVVTYTGVGASITFTLTTPTKSPDQLAWLQVVRTGSRTRWFTSEADIKALSKNNPNFLLRTDPTHGFRVDKTKNENVPFWEQTPVKAGKTLQTYRLGFDITHGSLPDSSRKGASMKMSDNPDPAGGLSRMKAVDRTVDLYRYHFLTSVLSVKTGKFYGTVEWCLQATAGSGVQFCQPKLVDDIGHPGQKLAYERWNTPFANGYAKLPYPCPGCEKSVVFKVPGKAVSW